MTYAAVRAKFTGLMNRRDLNADINLQKSFIQDAIKRIQRELRIPAMEKSLPLTWDATTYPYGEIPIPADYLKLKEIVYVDANDGWTLRQAPLSIVLRENLTVDHPRRFARRGTVWKLAPQPSAGDSISVDYYTPFSILSADTDTNYLTETADDLLVFCACTIACGYYKDNRMDGFETAYETTRDDIQGSADDAELTEGAQVAPTYLFED